MNLIITQAHSRKSGNVNQFLRNRNRRSRSVLNVFCAVSFRILIFAFRNQIFHNVTTIYHSPRTIRRRCVYIYICSYFFELSTQGPFRCLRCIRVIRDAVLVEYTCTRRLRWYRGRSLWEKIMGAICTILSFHLDAEIIDHETWKVSAFRVSIYHDFVNHYC